MYILSGSQTAVDVRSLTPPPGVRKRLCKGYNCLKLKAVRSTSWCSRRRSLVSVIYM